MKRRIFFRILFLVLFFPTVALSQESMIIEGRSSKSSPLSEKRLLLTMVPASTPTFSGKAKTDEAFAHSANQYVNNGNEYSQKSDYDKAEEEYEKALAIDSKNIFAYINMGVTYTNRHQYLKAAGCFKKAIEIDPKCAPAHLDLAVIYDECLCEKGKAKEHYRKFLDFDNSMDFKKRDKVKSWLMALEKNG